MIKIPRRLTPIRKRRWLGSLMGSGRLLLLGLESFSQFVGDLSRVPSLSGGVIKTLTLQVCLVQNEARQLVLYSPKDQSELTLRLTPTSKLRSDKNLGFKRGLMLENISPGCVVRVSFNPNLEVRDLRLMSLATEKTSDSEAQGATNTRSRKDRETTSEAGTLRIDVNLATVGVRVRDRNGKEVSGLNEADFSLFEDGIPQTIAVFSSFQEPVSLAILMDRSLSMGEEGRFERAKAAAISLVKLVKSTNRDSEFLYLGFHSEVDPIVGFENNDERVGLAIQNTELERSGTSFYDAMIKALELMKTSRHKRQALVVFTDGADQHSNSRLEDLIEVVQSSQAQVFAIGCFKPEDDALFRHSGEQLTLISGKAVDNPRSVFKRLAEESGAEYFFPKKTSQISQAVESISEHLKQQYTLAYYPQGSRQQGYRRISVTINSNARLRVSARHGIRLALEQARTPQSGQPTLSPRIKEVLSRPPSFESKVREKDNGLKEYREDFSDPSSGWPHNKAAFYAENSYHVVEAEKVVANGPWFRDFEAFITVELKKGLWQFNSPDEMSIIRASNVDKNDGMIGPRIATMGGGPGAGLVFRLNENGYYALLISGLPKGGKSFAKLVRKNVRKDELVELLPWTEVRDSVNPQGQKRIGVSCTGDSMKLYLGKNLIGSVQDDALSDGMVGIVLTGPGHAIFSDLIVEENALIPTAKKVH